LGINLLRGAAIALLIAAAISGCAQDPNKVVISVGRDLNAFADGVRPDGNEARDYASLYLPYAEMSVLAKAESLQPNGCPAPHLGKYLNGWRCVAGWHNEIPRTRSGQATWAVPGLGVSIWRYRGTCNLAVVFRGSDFTEWEDWRANLRGLLPFSLTKDQYDYVSWGFENVVARAGCGQRGTLVTVGHSLGAGLAQAAAFSNSGKRNPRVKYVFAFDPSPVTAWLEQDPDKILERSRFLAVDRVYEVGEILQAVRFVLHGFANPRDCRPRVRLVRFNATTIGNLIYQHEIAVLRNNFARISGAEKNSGNNHATTGVISRADGSYFAANCVLR
jgi:pimeloyl-ACP methyl ester carboxylesterase